MLSFPEFLAAAHSGREPYPWQVRFAEACASGTPPPVVAVPTGAGKTTVLEALIWALATQADRPAHERTVGCRTVWAIDRRILVDEVHELTTELANRLQEACDAPSNPLHPLARSLRELAGEESAPPLVATRWRGGIDDERQLLSPTQPQVITSTVAQIGSRLLFRGYGVGARSLTLEAGLAACDTNICLDEAHLVRPFVETVEAIRGFRARHDSEVALPPLTSITLTATPESRPEGTIELGPEDREALGRRRTGSKLARLDDTAATERERASRIAELATEHTENGAAKVACVVNSVRQAIAVHSLLQKANKDEGWDLALLIGPQRPVDRAKTLDEGPASALFHERRGEPPAKPLICVATQTFEVGLDADVEALVTESASASALVQRFGRLNRRGASEGRATIVRDEGSWLYGEEEELAWKWLLSRQGADGTIDLSVAALEEDDARPRPLAPPLAPELTEETVELLVQANPLPGPFQDPDVEPFLAGGESEPASDVSICWRCDLRFEEEPDHAYREALLRLAPPTAQEKLPLSLRGARMLLAALHPDRESGRKATLQAAIAESDVEGGSPESKLPPLGGATARFVVIRGDEILSGSLGHDPGAVTPSRLAPGDTVVVPSELGARAADLKLPWVTRESTADAAQDVHPPEGTPDAVRISPAVIDAVNGAKSENDQIREVAWRWTARMCREAEGAAPARRRAVLKELAKRFPRHRALSVLAEDADAEWELRFEVVGAESAALEEPDEDAAGVVPAEDAEPPESPVDDPVAARTGPTWVIRVIPKIARDRAQRSLDEVPTIASHAQAVAARVAAYCQRLRIDPSLAAALDLAARAHDHGKADRRIQDFFRGGSSAIAEDPIAKSVFGTGSPSVSRRAAEHAGLPRRLRHEVASAAILTDALARDPSLCPPGVDPSLADYLVLGHHGRGQPFPAVPEGGDPPQGVFCDAAGIAGSARGDGIEDWVSGRPLESFWDVIGRYGAWGSAYLLSILMIADRTVSSEGR